MPHTANWFAIDRQRQRDANSLHASRMVVTECPEDGGDIDAEGFCKNEACKYAEANYHDTEGLW